VKKHPDYLIKADITLKIIVAEYSSFDNFINSVNENKYDKKLEIMD